MASTTKRDGYHHGDLRQALLDAGMELVTERGLEGFTLREVARRAGVSHAAPYHHFEDRDALVTALALDAFGRFGTAMERAGRRARSGPVERIRALGIAYVRFALDEPERFTLMFRAELRSSEEATPVERAGLASYQLLIDAVTEAQGEGVIAVGHGPQIVSLMAWSTVHGLATLLVDGPMRRQAGTWRAVQPTVDAVIDDLVEGLRRP
jgi:AcrR family transcriptional regulator